MGVPADFALGMETREISHHPQRPCPEVAGGSKFVLKLSIIFIVK